MNVTLDRPSVDEIEVSVFGKGVGECSIVHIGDGRWVVIDSFLDDDAEPVAKSYLQHLGFDGSAIELVILTHWHDDHIKGASELVNWAEDCLVAYSSVLTHDEFRASIQRAMPAGGTHYSSGVRELKKLAMQLREAPHRKRHAMAQRNLLSLAHTRIEALSPSDEDLQIFIAEVNTWPAASDVDTVLRKPDRNDTSVAVAFDVGNQLLLFGADLEIRGELSGWQAVHELYWNERGRCSFYKIAHHGSPNAHYEPKWDHMLEEQVFAALTPYGRGVTPRPSIEDVNRILDRTDNAFSAGTVKLLSPRRQHNSVERTMSEASIKLKRICDKLGHVRLRCGVQETNWHCDLIGQAEGLRRQNP